MTELSIDMATANRFISSLSKSLQALCHGCMEFDSGIEIGGYIYISVDRGSKVDYVLNEMVEKSANNSMKFISNSFLAKKDQLKQTRDEACSPVPELQVLRSHQKNSFTYVGGQHHRSSYPFSPQSRVLRGAQKRSWSGTDRSPRKHFRGGKQSFSSKPDSKDLFPHPETPMSSESSSINVKQEMLEADDQPTGDCGSRILQANHENGDYNSGDHVDIKSEASVSNQDSLDRDVPFKQSQHGSSLMDSNFVSEGEQNVSTNLASGSNQSQADYETSDLPVTFSYNEETDLSTDGFDVIEIGDDDKDVQAMFGDNQCGGAVDLYHHLSLSEQETGPRDKGDKGYVCWVCQDSQPTFHLLKSHLFNTHGLDLPFKCQLCQRSFVTRASLKQHEKCHRIPSFFCECGAKFKYKHHLKRHMVSAHGLNQ